MQAHYGIYNNNILNIAEAFERQKTKSMTMGKKKTSIFLTVHLSAKVKRKSRYIINVKIIHIFNNFIRQEELKLIQTAQKIVSTLINYPKVNHLKYFSEFYHNFF